MKSAVQNPKSPIQNPDEESALGRRVRDAGDLIARDELVRRHRPFAIYLGRSYQRRCRCWEDDVVQAALLGLVKGANAWDPDDPDADGKGFLTYARYYVRMEIMVYLYDGRSLIHIPHNARPRALGRKLVVDEKKSNGWKKNRSWIEISAARAGHVVQGHDVELDHPDPSQSFPDSDDTHAENLEQLRLGLEMLPPWHAEVLRRRFGLGDRPKETAKAIAREAGVAPQTIFKIQRAALGRLRKAMTPAISA
jgi:RNA polymerase sigma factor (sigma-70 family)